MRNPFRRRRPQPRHQAPSWDWPEEQQPSPGSWADLPPGAAYWPVVRPAEDLEEPPTPELLDDLPDALHPHPSCCGRPQSTECRWLGTRGYLCFTHDWRWHEREERLAQTGDFRALTAGVDDGQAANVAAIADAQSVPFGLGELGKYATDNYADSDEEPRRCMDCGTSTGGHCVWCAQPVCSSCAATGHDCSSLSAPEFDEAPSMAATAEPVDVSASTRAYVADLAVLTRYRIPAE